MMPLMPSDVLASEVLRASEANRCLEVVRDLIKALNEVLFFNNDLSEEVSVCEDHSVYGTYKDAIIAFRRVGSRFELDVNFIQHVLNAVVSSGGPEAVIPAITAITGVLASGFGLSRNIISL